MTLIASNGGERRAQGNPWPAALVPFDEAELVAALVEEAGTYNLDGGDPAAWAEYVAALTEEAGTAYAELVELLKRDEAAHREAWAEYVAALKRDAEAVEKLLADPRNMP